MSNSNPNSKSPIFLLKTKNTPQDGYEEYFSESSQYNPIFVPVLEHSLNTTNLHKVRDLFISGDITRQYGGLVFTSQRAVEGFTKVIQEEVGESTTIETSRFLNFYTVGPATYNSLGLLRDTHFQHAELIDEEAGTGQILAGLILEHYNKHHARNRGTNHKHNQSENQNQNQTKLPLLFLVGEVHRDVIPKTLSSPALPVEERIEIHELIVYETDVMASFEADFKSAIEKEKEKEGGWIVVFSPTGCGAMLKVLGILSDKGVMGQKRGDGKANYHIATIGPTTRDHLRDKFGVEPDVCAERPSPDGVGRGIGMFLEKGI